MYANKGYTWGQCSAVFDQWSGYSVVQTYPVPNFSESSILYWDVLYRDEFPKDLNGAIDVSYPDGWNCCGTEPNSHPTHDLTKEGCVREGAKYDKTTSTQANSHLGCRVACANDPRCEEVWAYDHGGCCLKGGPSIQIIPIIKGLDTYKQVELTTGNASIRSLQLTFLPWAMLQPLDQHGLPARLHQQLGATALIE